MEERALGSVDSNSLDSLEKQVLLDICLDPKLSEKGFSNETLKQNIRATEGAGASPSTSFLLSEKTMQGGGVFCRHSSR